MSVSTTTTTTGVGAAAGSEFLRKDLLRINAEFDSGKLRAFGDAQDDVLKQFQRVRQLQVALSLKQVAMLGDDKEHSERDIDDLTRRLTEIAAEMQTVMSGVAKSGGSNVAAGNRKGKRRGQENENQRKKEMVAGEAEEEDDDDDVDDVDDDDEDDEDDIED